MPVAGLTSQYMKQCHFDEFQWALKFVICCCHVRNYHGQLWFVRMRSCAVRRIDCVVLCTPSAHNCQLSHTWCFLEVLLWWHNKTSRKHHVCDSWQLCALGVHNTRQHVMMTYSQNASSEILCRIVKSDNWQIDASDISCNWFYQRLWSYSTTTLYKSSIIIVLLLPFNVHWCQIVTFKSVQCHPCLTYHF